MSIGKKLAFAGLVLGILAVLAWFYRSELKPYADRIAVVFQWTTSESAAKTLDKTHDHDHDHDHDDHDDHVDISANAAANLGMNLSRLQRVPYTKFVHIPAAIVEKPGRSGLAVASPIQGIVSQIHCFPGQALDPGDLLFTMRVTDEALESAQLSLLEILTRVTVTEREIDRLDPLAESGAVVGRRKLEMEYQLKTLLSEKAARLQELKLRGLSTEQVQAITETRELISEIEIRLQVPAPEANTLADPSPALIYTVEQLDVYPGKSVLKGEEMCHVANHFELYVRGEAFESDVPAILQAMQQGWDITVETGEGPGHERIEGLAVVYMDNHVDTRTHTFPFYAGISNRVVSQHQDQQGRVFRSWRFKPGQRVHVFVPQETWDDQFVVPRDAVVDGGVETYVFRLAESLEDIAFYRTPDDRLAKIDRRSMWELQPIPVRVVHKDRRYVVLATDGELTDQDIVVTSGAYQAYLAWKLQTAGGGGGHDHVH